jgi:RND family efflux transporter MFP subunit
MSIRRNENPACRRRLLLLGGCAVLSMLLGADEPASGKIALEVKGYIVPVRQVTVSPKAAGQVVELPIEEGHEVKRGDVLARLDPAEYQAEVRLTHAKMKLAEALFAKAKELGGRADILIAQAKVEVARAEVGIAERRLEGCTVRAPLGGTVLVKRVEVGSRVDPRGPSNSISSVCDLADLQALDVELSIGERDAPLVEKGQKCLIRLPAYPRKLYKGTVSRLLPVADRAKGCVTVRVRLELPEADARLRPESGVLVQVLRKE